MISLGLSATDQRAFESGLLRDHRMRVLVQVLDLEHRVKGIATGRVLSGQVDVDVSSDGVTRSCSLEVMDPDNALNLDAGDPRAASATGDRMVQVHYGVWSQQLPRWVNVPVFTGPLTGVKRGGDGTLSITATGKESLASGPWSGNARWRKGTFVTTIIREMLGLAGERFMEIPHWTAKTATDVVVGPMDDLWVRAQALARSLGDVRLAYDGRGFVHLWRHSGGVRWTFRGGNSSSLLSLPDVSSDTSAVKNLVVVTGGTPKGAKKRVVGLAHAPAAHPMSSTSLGRGGRKRYLREDVEDDTITSQKKADEVAQARLSDLLRASVEVTFDSLVIPHLEPWDVVQVDAQRWTWPMQLQKFTIPLSADGRMSVGRTGLVRSVRRQRGR